MKRGRPAQRRAQMLDYIAGEIDREGIAPSYAMIQRALSIHCRRDVDRMVQAAERDGKLRRVGAGRVRRIHLTIFPSISAQ